MRFYLALLTALSFGQAAAKETKDKNVCVHIVKPLWGQLYSGDQGVLKDANNRAIGGFSAVDQTPLGQIANGLAEKKFLRKQAENDGPYLAEFDGGPRAYLFDWTELGRSQCTELAELPDNGKPPPDPTTERTKRFGDAVAKFERHYGSPIAGAGAK